jgi:diacylglycerol kinase (ATP)
MEMNKPDKKHPLMRLVYATGYSWAGLKAAFKSEAAFREEIYLIIVLLPVLYCLPVSITQKILLLFSLFFLLIAELINTAIEAIVDRISHDIHPLSKIAKDIGSAIVLLSLLNAACCWGMVLYRLYFNGPLYR